MDSKGSKENNLICIYTIVEAQSIIDLVRLTNLKTKKGWKCLGGMCFISLPNIEYPFCQSMYKMGKVEEKKFEKKFTAFPYKGGESSPVQIPSDDYTKLEDHHTKPASKVLTKRKKVVFKKKFVVHPLKKK